jgi:hypothetical protein
VRPCGSVRLPQALRRLVIFGFPADTRSLQQVPAVAQVLPAVLQALQVMLPLQPPLPTRGSQLHAMLDRGVLKLAKTIANIQDTHPW